MIHLRCKRRYVGYTGMAPELLAHDRGDGTSGFPWRRCQSTPLLEPAGLWPVLSGAADMKLARQRLLVEAGDSFCQES